MPYTFWIFCLYSTPQCLFLASCANVLSRTILRSPTMPIPCLQSRSPWTGWDSGLGSLRRQWWMKDSSKCCRVEGGDVWLGTHRPRKTAFWNSIEDSFCLLCLRMLSLCWILHVRHTILERNLCDSHIPLLPYHEEAFFTFHNELEIKIIYFFSHTCATLLLLFK